MTAKTAKTFRTLLAALLATFSLASGMVSPILDATDRDHGPVFESGHDASVCGYGHDEGICTQVTGNLAQASHPVVQRFDLAAHRFDPFLLRDEVAPRAPTFLPLGSRAPPLA